jgi:PEP-CTERM motif
MKVRLTLGLALAMSIPGAFGDVIAVNSSSSDTFLDSGFTSQDFTSPFTAANFTSARTGPTSFVQASTPFYISSLPSAPAARWIGTNATSAVNVGDTALFAVSFNIADPFSSGSFSMFYAVDNELGGTVPGIYLNGIALPSSTGIGTFTSQFTYSDASVGADLVQGTNFLYIDAVNLGAEEGLIFSATISTVNASATPEPGSLLLLGSGFLLGGVIWRRKFLAH